MRNLSPILLFICLTCGVAAEAEHPSKAPAEAMNKLSSLSGDWQLQVKASFDDGKTWQQSEPVSVQLVFKQRGLMLEEIPLQIVEQGFNMHTLITYDQYRQVYRKAAIDDVWGIMDLYEGQWQEDKLVFTNLKAGTLFPVGEDTWRGFRLTMQVSPDSRTTWIDKTDDMGKSWQPAFILEYKKKAS
ncbi:DUF1579 family protein [Aliiglaciecola sp. CAU 1673]|uniref:DUF1579 family protein n=1 Tax=Aliiglaciecola sp. CAU 1673 TaxID=3032595 RepID=UPI0023DA16A8|nr:DUF1579 family protein [Aliiglaciecola sp. CAU 1673]MDF2178815.1 DUF1579 family protein [Aliiglaciecola sp. CAU 1673]